MENKLNFGLFHPRGLSRVLVPIIFGVVLFTEVYILHLFEEMEFSIFGVLVMVIPVIVIFELTRFINQRMRRNDESNQIGTSLRILLVSFVVSEVLIFSLYIPRKTYEINHGVQDSITLFHVLTIGIQVLIIVLVANGYYQFRHYVDNWHMERTRSLRLEKANAEARASSIRDQISPHFLFNNLNTLYGLVENEGAKLYLKKLADLYREVLSTRNDEAITLKEELKNLDRYVYLLGVRFGSMLTIESDVSCNEDEMIPPFVLQQLLENAIKHNKFSENSPLSVSIRREGQRLLISNTLNPNPDVDSTKVGLENLIERFKLLTNEPVQIVKEKHQFEVSVPILKLNSD